MKKKLLIGIDTGRYGYFGPPQIPLIDVRNLLGTTLVPIFQFVLY